jgi:hypothetical protein
MRSLVQWRSSFIRPHEVGQAVQVGGSVAVEPRRPLFSGTRTGALRARCSTPPRTDSIDVAVELVRHVLLDQIRPVASPLPEARLDFLEERQIALIAQPVEGFSGHRER